MEHTCQVELGGVEVVLVGIKSLRKLTGVRSCTLKHTLDNSTGENNLYKWIGNKMVLTRDMLWHQYYGLLHLVRDN